MRNWISSPLVYTQNHTPKQPADNSLTSCVINHPSHYVDGGIEAIDYIEAKQLGYHLGNAVKYISRAGKKDPQAYVTDLQKAAWYIDRAIEHAKKSR